MKLIQQLERKLSWRSSQRNPRSHQPTTPGLAEGKQRKEKSSKKRAQQQLKQAAAKNAAAVRVSDSEFSAYISFGSGLKTVPLNTAADSATSSYQVVAIRTRAPFQSVGQPPPLLYSSPNHRHHSQSPSPRSEGHRQESDQGENGEHIYDRIDISNRRPAPISTNQHRRSCSLSPTVYQNPNPNWSPCSEGAAPFSGPAGSQSPTTSWGSNESGSGSSSSQCGPIRRRRNRIKTNPWVSCSPWTTKALQEKENQPQENIYESIENLLSGSRRKTEPNPINQSYTPPFAQPPHYYPTTNQGTYLKRAARPTTLAVQQRKQKHLITEIYPTSPYHLSSNSQKLSRPAEASPDDLHLLTSPSVEFLNQSQQLCRQISSYFDRPSSPANETSTSSRPSFERKESNTLERRESTDSMETIDLSPVNLKSQSAQLSEWSLAEDNNELNDHYQSKTVSSPAPTPPSPAFRSKRKLASPNMSRPESIYANSRKQSAKVDRLKCQLKEVVHAAIQQAKKKKV